MKILEVEDEEEQEDTTLVNGKTKKSSASVAQEAQNSSAKTSDDVEVLQANSNTSTNLEADVKLDGSKDANEQKSVDSVTSNAEKRNTVVTENTQRNSDDEVKSKEEECKVVETEPEIEQPTKVVQTPLPPELEKVKDEAGDLFRAGQYGAASDKYTAVIKRLTTKAQNDPNATYSHALATLFNNRAACWLKSGNDKACIADCDRVLELKPLDVKALIRRASAYEHMEKYRLAFDDFRAAQAIDWTATQAQTGANRVAKHLRDVYGPNWREPEKGKGSSNSQNVSPPTTNHVPSKPHEKPTTNGKVLQNEKNTKPVKPTVSASKKEKKNSNSESAKSNRAAEKPTQKRNAAPDASSVNAQNREKESIKTDSKDKARAKLSQELFLKLKSEGNNLVQKGKYEEAVKSYTQCIKISPQEVASYTNRALCFLKLKKDSSATGDCTKALELDPKNVKAYYRRAQANKNQELYLSAIRDLRKVLEIEPSNKPAMNELEQVQKLVQTNSKRKVPITDVSEDESSSEEEEEKPPNAQENKSQSTSTTNSSEVTNASNKIESDTNALRSNRSVLTEDSTKSETVEPPKPNSNSLEDAVKLQSSSSETEKPQKHNSDDLKSATKSETMLSEAEHKPTSADSVKAEKVETASNKSTTLPTASSTGVTFGASDKNPDLETKPNPKTEKASESPKPSPPKQARSKASSVSERPATSVSDFRLQVPENLTPYEFGNLWNSVQPKSNIEAYKCILDNITAEHIPAMVSNKTNDHLIITFAKIAQKHASAGTMLECDRAYKILLQLTKADRFQMAAMFLSKSDKEVVSKALTDLENLENSIPVTFSNSNLNTLRKAYML